MRCGEQNYRGRRRQGRRLREFRGFGGVIDVQVSQPQSFEAQKHCDICLAVPRTWVAPAPALGVSGNDSRDEMGGKGRGAMLPTHGQTLCGQMRLCAAMCAFVRILGKTVGRPPSWAGIIFTTGLSKALNSALASSREAPKFKLQCGRNTRIKKTVGSHTLAYARLCSDMLGYFTGRAECGATGLGGKGALAERAAKRHVWAESRLSRNEMAT